MTLLMPVLDNTTIGLLAASGGAVVVKVIDKLLEKRGEYLKEGQVIREELRKNLDMSHEELELSRREADMWRKKYWELVTECAIRGYKIDHQIDDASTDQPEL